jgi:hypothetical protein
MAKIASTLDKEQVIALRGLRLSSAVLKRLHHVRIHCQPAVSIQYQNLARRYVLRGLESGGAVPELGLYCSFVHRTGNPLSWLQKTDEIDRNRVHADVVAPHFVRIQMCRNEQTYELLITEHRLENPQESRRPKLVNTILFHGFHGTLALKLWGQDRHLTGQVFPVFYKPSAEALRIPEEFHEAVRRATAGACCIGCKHCHLLQPPLTTTAAIVKPTWDGRQ